jgi:hypothetical protein
MVDYVHVFLDLVEGKRRRLGKAHKTSCCVCVKVCKHLTAAEVVVCSTISHVRQHYPCLDVCTYTRTLLLLSWNFMAVPSPPHTQIRRPHVMQISRIVKSLRPASKATIHAHQNHAAGEMRFTDYMCLLYLLHAHRV